MTRKIQAKTVTLKLKTIAFDVKTRATTLDSYVCDFDPVFNTAKASLLAEIAAAPSKKLRLRLMGMCTFLIRMVGGSQPGIRPIND